MRQRDEAIGKPEGSRESSRGQVGVIDTKRRHNSDQGQISHCSNTHGVAHDYKKMDPRQEETELAERGRINSMKTP